MLSPSIPNHLQSLQQLADRNVLLFVHVLFQRDSTVCSTWCYEECAGCGIGSGSSLKPVSHHETSSGGFEPQTTDILSLAPPVARHRMHDNSWSWQLSMCSWTLNTPHPVSRDQTHICLRLLLLLLPATITTTTTTTTITTPIPTTASTTSTSIATTPTGTTTPTTTTTTTVLLLVRLLLRRQQQLLLPPNSNKNNNRNTSAAAYNSAVVVALVPLLQPSL